MTWNFRWTDRPATKILTFDVDGETRGSVSIDKDDKESEAFWYKLIEYGIDIQNADPDINSIINQRTG